MPTDIRAEAEDTYTGQTVRSAYQDMVHRQAQRWTPGTGDVNPPDWYAPGITRPRSLGKAANLSEYQEHRRQYWLQSDDEQRRVRRAKAAK